MLKVMVLISFSLLQAMLVLLGCYFAILEGKIDSFRIFTIHAGRKFHRQNFFRRLGFVSGALLLPFAFLIYFIGWLPALLQAASLGFLIGSLFWILFNASINLHLGRPILQHGKTAAIDKLQAALFRKLPAWFEQAALLLISLAIYIYFTGFVFVCLI